KRSGFTLAGPELNLLKGAEFFYRACYAGHQVADIELHDLFSRPLPRILHINSHLEAVPDGYFTGAQPGFTIFEIRITQAVPERIKGRILHIDIFGSIFFAGGRPAGTLVVIIVGNLSDAPGKGNRQFAGWIIVTKQDRKSTRLN